MFDKEQPKDARKGEVYRMNSEGFVVNEILFEKFPTIQNRYTSPVNCAVAIWSVGDVPKIPSVME